MAMFELIGATVNGWVAALGGVAVVLFLSASLRAYHELYVRRMLWKIYVEMKKEGVVDGEDK